VWSKRVESKLNEAAAKQAEKQACKRAAKQARFALVN